MLLGHIQGEQPMKRIVWGSFTSLAMAVTLSATLAAQSTSQSQIPPNPQSTTAIQDQKTPTDVTFTGCVIEGSSPSIYLLVNALDPKSPVDPSSKAIAFRLTGAKEDLDFQPNVNHRVQVTGKLIPLAST